MPKPGADVPENRIPQITDAGALELLKREPGTRFPPGSRWEYSNSGYCVLAMVVEQVSGQPFGTFLRDRVFAPLKMTRTVAYQKGWNDVPDRAYGHTPADAGWKETDQSPTSATLGDGGIYSSLDDLVKWDAALRAHTLLGEMEMREALTPVAVSGGSASVPTANLSATGSAGSSTGTAAWIACGTTGRRSGFGRRSSVSRRLG